MWEVIQVKSAIKEKVDTAVMMDHKRTDRPLNVIHRFVIAAMVCMVVWNGYCAWNWLRTNTVLTTDAGFPTILPFLPDIGPFVGVLTLVVTMMGVLALYGLITHKKNSWLYAVWSLCLSAAVKNLLCVLLWLDGRFDGERIGVAIDIVFCLIAMGAMRYYWSRQDNFAVDWKKELGHHLTVGAMFALMFWCAYCGVWWLGTQKMVFSSTWQVLYPVTIPSMGHRGWIIGLVAAMMVIYCIVTISGLLRHKKLSNYLAVLTFPLVVLMNLVAYWHENFANRYYRSVLEPCTETPFLLITALIGGIGVLVYIYYKSRKDRFCNSW